MKVDHRYGAVDPLVQLIRTLAHHVGLGRSAVDCARVLGDVGGPLTPGVAASVRLGTPLLSAAMVMPLADGTAAFVILQPAADPPVLIDHLVALGPTTAPYIVAPRAPRRVRFESPIDGCVVSVDLADDDAVGAMYVRREGS